jgi:hypothetical protein
MGDGRLGTMGSVCVLRWSLGRSPVAFRGLYVLTCLVALFAHADAVVGRDNSIGPTERITFDIPSQHLMSALESYGAASRCEVLYDARLATGRVSADVKGVFTRSEALQILLAGTGLVGRFTSENAVVVVPSSPAVVHQTTPAIDAKGGNPLIRAGYYGVVQERIRDAFCENVMLRPGRYRIAVRFWIAPTGAVQQTQLLSTTGDGRIDDAIESTLRGLKIGQVPPPGVSQPFTMIVLPRPLEQTQDCAAVDSVRYNGGAN